MKCTFYQHRPSESKPGFFEVQFCSEKADVIWEGATYCLAHFRFITGVLLSDQYRPPEQPEKKEGVGVQ